MPDSSFEIDGIEHDLYITRNISEKRGVSRFRVSPEKVCKYEFAPPLPRGKSDYILLNWTSISEEKCELDESFK